MPPFLRWLLTTFRIRASCGSTPLRSSSLSGLPKANPSHEWKTCFFSPILCLPSTINVSFSVCLYLRQRMKKHSLVIKHPALQQPWQLEIFRSGAVHWVCVTAKAGKEVESCCLIVSKAGLILYALFLAFVSFHFVLYQAHYLAAKGPNFKGDNLFCK